MANIGLQECIIFIVALVCITMGTYIIIKRKNIIEYSLSYYLISLLCICYYVCLISNRTEAVKITTEISVVAKAVLILCLAIYTSGLTKNPKKKSCIDIAIPFAWFGMFLDTIFVVINNSTDCIFKLLVAEDGSYLYQFQVMYYYHLAFCISIAVVIAIAFIESLIQVPKLYKGRYYMALTLILFISVWELFLYINKVSNMEFYSLIAFFIGAVCFFVIIVNPFMYGPVMIIRSRIMDEIGKHVILFDYTGNLAAYSKSAAEILEDNTEIKLNDFIRKMNMNDYVGNPESDTTFLWQEPKDKKEYSVDYRILRDEKNTIIGNLFIYTPYDKSLDMMTGFYSYSGFVEQVESRIYKMEFPSSLALIDITGLGYINDVCGTENGDKAITYLAGKLKQAFPDYTVFGRQNDSSFVLMVEGHNRQNTEGLLEEIKLAIKKTSGVPLDINIQFIVSEINSVNRNIVKELQLMKNDLKTHKLISRTSVHSSLLDSMMQIQNERNPQEMEHINRTRAMADVFGKRLGLSERQQVELQLLCIVHDIGLVGVPINLINKPGKLNEEEWDALKSHVEKGYRIVTISEELSNIAIFVLHHHEAWDGSGYPDGLSKQTIPILSRIISIIDTYDAITNDRPYRKAMPSKMAREEIRKQAGKMFDPALADSFLQMLEEIAPIDEEQEKVLMKNREEIIFPKGAEETLNSHSQMPYVTFSKYTLDADNVIIDSDSEFAELTGYTKEYILKNKISQQDLIFPEELNEYKERVYSMLRRDGEAYLCHRIRRKDGGVRFVFCYGRQYFDELSLSVKSQIMVTDITDKYNSDKYLERLSYKNNIMFVKQIEKDEDTGFYNAEHIKEKIRSTEIKSGTYMLLMVICLESVNIADDSFDSRKIMSKSADALRKVLDRSCQVGRIHDNEFLVWQEITNENGLAEDEIQNIVADIWGNVMFYINQDRTVANVSIGAAYSHNEKLSLSNIFGGASRMLLEAKLVGGKCYKIKEMK